MNNKEIPNGKRRKRCVNCNKLTWSNWYLTYPRDDEYIKGFHCYDCYDLFDNGSLQDDINTKDKEKSFEETVTQALGVPKELFNNKPSNKDFTNKYSG